MTPPISTDACAASVSTVSISSGSTSVQPQLSPSNNGGQPSSLNSLFMMDDLDQFILKDLHANDLLNSNFNALHHTGHFHDAYTDTDIFSFDKMNSTFASTGLFDINPYGGHDSIMHYTNYNSSSSGSQCGSSASLMNNIMNFNANVDDDEDEDDDVDDEDDEDLEKNFSLNQDDESDGISDDFLANLEDQEINESLLFGVDNHFSLISQPTANDTMMAIREITLRDENNQKQRMQHQMHAKQNRKHKNSTSSVSSVSMTSTIKKVAIELQNSTANLVSGTNTNNSSSTMGIFNYNLKQASNVKSVPISYDINNFIFNSTNSNNSNSTNSNSLNVELMCNELKPDLVDSFIDDENGFEDLLCQEDWIKMLDEDCISRLTADFNFTSNCNTTNNNNNNNNNKSTPITDSTDNSKISTPSKQSLVHNQTTFTNGTKPNQPLVLVLSSNSSNSSSSSSSPSSLSSSSLSSPNNYSHQLNSSANNKQQPLNKTSVTQITKLVTTTPNSSQSANKILTTTTTTKTLSPDSATSNVVKKLNSVTLVSNSNNNNKNNTFTLDNKINANSNKNIILKNKTNNQSITATSGCGITQTVNSGSSLVSAKAKTLAKPLNGSMITTTAQTISIIKSPIKKPLVISAASITNTTPVVSSTTPIVNNTNNVTTSTSTNSANSLIDFSDIIDCVNPDQIFPYRLPLLRFNKSELDEQMNSSSNSSSGDDSIDLRNSAQHADNSRKVLLGYAEDDDDDEEIDVVTINTQQISSSTTNMNSTTNLNNEHTLLNSNHHTYFHPANKLSKSNNSKQQQQQHKHQVVLLKNESDVSSNNTSNSYLASYLKQSPVNKSSINILAASNATNHPIVTKTISKQQALSFTQQNQNQQHQQQELINNENNIKRQSSSSFIKTTKLNSNNNSNQSVTTTTTVISKNQQQIQRKSQMSLAAGKKAANNNTNITSMTTGKQQVNSIRILSSQKSLPETTVAITKLSSPTLGLNKDILLQQHQQQNGSTTKYITMTSKLVANNTANVKCQAITPTTTTNKSLLNTVPKILTTANNSYLKLNANNNNNNNNNTFNSNNLTAIKLTNDSNTSLNKLNTIRKVNKTKTTVSISDTNSFDDEFYYEDEDFNRRLNLTGIKAQPAAKPINTSINNKLKIEPIHNANEANRDLIDYQQQHTMSNTYEDEDDLDDDDDLDDEDDDDDSSSSTPSPGSSSSPLTSSGTSSGYSTPTKSKSSGKHDMNSKHTAGGSSHINDSSLDMNVLNEKLNKKQTSKKKAMQQNMSSSVSSSSSSLTGQQLNGSQTSSKRISRLGSMGSIDNPAEKRAFHILSERQRRNDLKKLFETLRVNIPVLCDKQKASKLTILKAAVEHLAEVSNKKEKLCSVFDKEKQKHSKLMQQLKSLQQQQQHTQQQHQQQIHNNLNSYSSSISNGQQSLTTLAVH
jgi:hypothetical protein